MSTPYGILYAKREGERLDERALRAVARGAVDGSWTDAQLGAFLMAAVLRGLDLDETRLLTVAMLESGERWELGREVPGLGDKHSTGGVGDKVSLILAPLLAACGQPVVMLTGRGLGHTGGTADKLEGIPGLSLELDRAACLRLLEEVGLAIGVATAAIAPADRRLYALRDATATVDSLELIAASILSKKLATGAAAIAFDVKTGDGAFLTDLEAGRRLARLLVETCSALGHRSSVLITDMSQPLGEWVGHHAEILEALDCLAGEGPEDLMEVVYALSFEVARLTGCALDRPELEAAVASGAARQRFAEWTLAQGADPSWMARPALELAPEEVVVEAPREGVLARVHTRKLGLLLVAAGGGRSRHGETIDRGVALRYRARLGRRVEAGEELARIHLRRPDEALVEELRSCFEVADRGEAPRLVRERIGPE